MCTRSAAPKSAARVRAARSQREPHAYARRAPKGCRTCTRGTVFRGAPCVQMRHFLEARRAYTCSTLWDRAARKPAAIVGEGASHTRASLFGTAPGVRVQHSFGARHAYTCGTFMRVF